MSIKPKAIEDIPQDRERWLIQALELLRDGVFSPRDRRLPPLKVTVSLPYTRDQKATLIQYFPPALNKDKIGQLLLNPSVDNGIEAVRHLYRASETQIARSGPDARPLPHGPDETKMLQAIVSALGPYPNAALLLPDKFTQDTRMLKISCPHCGYLARATARWISTGLPTCPCGTKMRFDEPGKPKP